MCGIVGICHLKGEPVSTSLLKKMTDTMAYRGPDDEGHYTDGPVGLGHRRLAIIDLSPAGHQPMADQTNDFVITYNGEIYNFQELRKELTALGHSFFSQSDTEVVLHAYKEWGEQCLERFNGMFAFALWDRSRRRLFLARDRYGIKPLYWYFRNGFFLFASEIKAILRHPQVSRGVCAPALNEYFTFQNIFTDLTLFEGIQLLPPGCFMLMDLREKDAGPRIKRYWDYPFPSQPLDLSEEECMDRLFLLFEKAVERQLVSDVPVGAYLSGGMDSGSITAVARRRLGRLTTFTGGFDLSSASGMELGYDERARSEVLANLLKTEHYEMVMHAGDMEHAMPDLIWHLEDLRVGQCYPNFYVARLAGKFVKVVVSGAGGDELFGGYPWRYYRGMNSANASDYYRNYYLFWQRLVPDEDKGLLFNASTYQRTRDHSTFDVFRGVFGSRDIPLMTKEDFVSASLYFELKTFLHGLLVVEDKVSMAHSLETRVPFLDNDLVEFACRIPVRYKLRDLVDRTQNVDEDDVRKYEPNAQVNSGKEVLRRAMQRLIPAEVTSRVKQGFSAPDASWYRGESIDYINRLLRSPKARIYEFLDPAYVGRILDLHCAGKENRRLLIWSFLSFEWWLQKFMGQPEG
jgi:asparagine synthase (glutamine-hydrolysing)